MSNKDLLLEIQKEAIDGNTELSTVLRKCLALATRLGHQPLKDWAQWELDGYPPSSELPDYRVLEGLHSFGHFIGFAGSAINNAPLSLLNLPESSRKNFQDPLLREGVASIAVLASHSDGTIRWVWPPEACAVFSHREYRDDLRLVQAWISIPVSRLVGLLDTIRNRVLRFALEMETLDLKLEEEVSSGGSNKATNAQITQTFHQTIYGPVSNVGTAGPISQTMIVNREISLL